MSPAKPDFSGHASAQNSCRQAVISSPLEHGLPPVAIALDIKKLTFVALSELFQVCQDVTGLAAYDRRNVCCCVAWQYCTPSALRFFPNILHTKQNRYAGLQKNQLSTKSAICLSSPLFRIVGCSHLVFLDKCIVSMAVDGGWVWASDLWGRHVVEVWAQAHCNSTC